MSPDCTLVPKPVGCVPNAMIHMPGKPTPSSNPYAFRPPTCTNTSDGSRTCQVNLANAYPNERPDTVEQTIQKWVQWHGVTLPQGYNRSSSQAYSLQFADIDNDGDLDLPGFENTPGGFYPWGTPFPHESNRSEHPGGLKDSIGMAWADWDGDGDIDAVAAGGLYRNDGAGNFEEAGIGSVTCVTTCAWADLNGDGTLDLLSFDDADNYRDPTDYQYNGSTLWMNNHPDGTFTLADDNFTKWLNTGSDTVVRGGSFSIGAFAFADFDLDGFIDVAVATRFSQSNAVWRGDGTGHFHPACGYAADYMGTVSGMFKYGAYTCTSMLFPGRTSVAVAWGGALAQLAISLPCSRTASRCVVAFLSDYDGDGDPDLVFGNNGQQDELYMNAGDGQLVAVTDSPAVSERTSTIGIFWLDMDRDGDLDLIAAAGGPDAGNIEVYWNTDGHGTLIKMTSPGFRASQKYIAIAAVDVTGDGQLDIVTATMVDQAEETSDEYGYGGDPMGGGMPGSVATDSEANAFRARSPAIPLLSTLQVYELEPTGKFVTAPSDPITAAGPTSAMALGDVNSDGVLDLLIGRDRTEDSCFDDICPQSLLNSGNSLYLGNSEGGFHPSSATMSERGHTADVELADYDNDGDLDLVVANRISATDDLNLIDEGSTDGIMSNQLFRNDNGVFVEVTSTALGPWSNTSEAFTGSSCVAWADYGVCTPYPLDACRPLP